MTLKQLLFLLITLFMSSCYYDIEDELYVVNNCEIPVEVSYEKDIEPFIYFSCAVAVCHSAENPDRISLENHADLTASIESGIFQTYTFEEQIMPTDGPLSLCEMELIKSWIDAGTPNN